MIYNGIALIPLLLGLAASAISGRVTLIWARGGAFHEIDQRRSAISSIIGALAFPAQLCLFVTAFFVMWWPLAIVAVLLVGIFLGLVVTRDTLAPLTHMQPMLNLITLAAAPVVIWLLVAR